MKKPKKSQKNSSDPSSKSRVIFETGEDDAQMFVDYLAFDTIPVKKGGESAGSGASPSRQPTNKAAPKRDGPLPEATIDLHGLSIADAEKRLEIEITALAVRGCLVVTIITGKGKNSENQNRTLAKEIPGFLRRKFGKVVVFLTDIAFTSSLSPLPAKGFFTIKVLPQTRR